MTSTARTQHASQQQSPSTGDAGVTPACGTGVAPACGTGVPPVDQRRDAVPAPHEVAARLRGVYVGLRPELEVSRHVFRGRVSYVLRDPMTFRTHRVDAADYRVLVCIDGARPLSEIFDSLVQSGALPREEELRFYEFVLSLHRIGLLTLPLSDDRVLFRRHAARVQARRRSALLNLLFLRIPLVNPDAFLARTLRLARPMFTRWFFAAWLLLVASAVAVAAALGRQWVEPLEGVLAARNLPLMWLTLVALKIFHEFGHAYACRILGGRVPEMGAYLILLTPCAYVDASASWAFTRKRDRLIVCLAGMYVEGTFAAVAVFVWALTDPSLLHDLAFNVVFLASIVTVVFNANPLMRYDGYYIAADLLEIPNLRQRSTQFVLDGLKRILLGVRSAAAPDPRERRQRWILASFGVAAFVYRVGVLLGILALIASKVFIAGLLLAGAFLGSMVYSAGRRLTWYLWRAPETAHVRVRAVAVSIAVLAALPAAAFLLPVPSAVRSDGVLGRGCETVVRAPAAGFVDRVVAQEGRDVAAGDLLTVLLNDELDDAVAEAAAAVESSRVREDALRVRQPAEALEERQRGRYLNEQLRRRRREQADLSVSAAVAGRMVRGLRPTDEGRFVPLGRPLAMLASGPWRVRTVLTEDELTDVRPRIGQQVEFRSSAAPSRVLRGAIVMIAPAGSRETERDQEQPPRPDRMDAPDEAVGIKSRRPQFDVWIDLAVADESSLRYGMTGSVRFPAPARPVGLTLFRRLVRFANTLEQS